MRVRARMVMETLGGERLALAGVLLLSAALNCYRLNREGFANLYYAAGVRSMLTSWHNFFFVSFDPGGFVSIDKPPLGFWLQALSAEILGFHGWSLLLPQALAAVLAVWLIERIVSRGFGPLAGLVAALALAVTPIDVVTARDNTIDSLLVPVVLLAAWAAIRAAETGRLRWLLLCAVLFGAGFNIKSLEALLALPACFLLYLVAAPRAWWVRCLHLAAASVVVVALALAWVAAVDHTPAADRPYVGSSTDDSELSLIVGHNGVDRLLPGRPTFRTASGHGIGGGSSSYETGAPGLLRLADRKLSGQLDWLLPLGMIGVAMAAVATGRPRRRLTARQQALLLWVVWFGSEAAFFSAAGYIHRYYLVVLTPAMAAMVGIGVAALWEGYRSGGWRTWALPVAVLATAGMQTHILDLSQVWRDWRVLPIAAALGGLGLLVGRLGWWAGPRLARFALAGSLALLTVAPLAWSATSVAAGQANPDSPVAGVHRMPLSDPDAAVREAAPVVRYLDAHRGGARFVLATANAQEAAPFVLASGQPVMAIGGFSGGDPILTSAAFVALVAAGNVRFVLVPDAQVHRAWKPAAASGPLAWVVGQCTPVTAGALAVGIGGTNPRSPALIPLAGRTYGLFHCSGAVSATPAGLLLGNANAWR